MAGNLPIGTTAPRGLPSPESVEWPLVPARDVFDLRYGKALVATDRRPGTVPVYGTNGQCGWHNTALFKGPGVILGRKGQGPLGVEWCETDYWVIDTAYSLDITRNDVDLRYAYFLISYIGLNHLKDGTSNPSLSRGTFGAQAIPLPPLPQQHVIAHILSSLDRKIELNRQMNEALEAIARALFMDNSIRSDWDTLRLGDVCTIYDGPHATPKVVDSGPIFLGISNLEDGLLNLSETAHVTESDFTTWTRRVVPFPGDVVFSYETRLGQAALIPEGFVGCLGRRMGLLRPKDGKTVAAILLRAFLDREFQETIRERTIHGSTVDRIPLKEMGEFPIRLPQGETKVELTKQLNALRAKVESNEKESVSLAALRDALLPKLISGELRVKDAEKFMGKVA